MISLMDRYPKLSRRLQELERQGARLITWGQSSSSKSEQSVQVGVPAEFPGWLAELLRDLAGIAASQGMEIMSCAEPIDLRQFGIHPGKCVDDEVFFKVFGVSVPGEKDLGQRPACGCIPSVDIGMYDTCLLGCSYCYATSSFERSWENYRRHDPEAASLIPLVHHK